MKKTFMKRAVFVLVLSLVLSQPAGILAAEDTDISNGSGSPAVLKQEKRGYEAPDAAVSQNCQEEIEESEKEITEQEQDETISGNGEEAAGATVTRTDCFGNKYTYDPVNWMKDAYYNRNDETKTILYNRLPSDTEAVPENFYLPASTVINGQTYKTQLNIGGAGIWGPPFHEAYGGTKLKQDRKSVV